MRADELKYIPREIAVSISPATLRYLSTPNTAYSLCQIYIEYIGIVAMILICLNFWSIPLYIFSLMYIASRQHALGVIMHDGVHYRISRNKILNDLITNFFITFPIFSSLERVRNIHFKHHKDPNTKDDPDWVNKHNNKEWVFPKTKLNYIITVCKYIGGIHILLYIFSRAYTIKQKLSYLINMVNFNGRVRSSLPHPKYSHAQRVFYYASLFLIICYFKLFVIVFLFWIMPLLFWIPFISKLRTIAEHFGVDSPISYERTRTTYPSFIDTYLLSANWNITYHIDHHFFPSVPSYNIRTLHSLIKDHPAYLEHAHITTNGYYGVFLECTN